MAELTGKQALLILDIAKSQLALQAPERRLREQERARDAALERLFITERGKERRQKPSVTGLSGFQSSFGRSQDLRAEIFRDVDLNDPKAVEAAEAQVAMLNRPEADFIRQVAIALLNAGDPGAAQLGMGLADVVSPPTKKALSKRRVAAAGRATATGEKPGSFRVTGGPRSGFTGEGTPAQILEQLLATRPESLQKKFGAHVGPPTAKARAKPEGVKTTAPKKEPFVEQRAPTPSGAFQTIFGDIPVPSALTRDLPLEATGGEQGMQLAELILSTLLTPGGSGFEDLLGRRP